MERLKNYIEKFGSKSKTQSNRTGDIITNIEEHSSKYFFLN